MVDDNPDDRMLIRRALVREFPEVEIIEVGDPKTLADALDDGPYDLVITDYGLGFTNGFALLDTLKAQWPECPVILCTGTLSEEIAVEALRKGLDDYVLKDPRRSGARWTTPGSARRPAPPSCATTSSSTARRSGSSGPCPTAASSPPTRPRSASRAIRAWPRSSTRTCPISTRTRATGPG